MEYNYRGMNWDKTISGNWTEIEFGVWPTEWSEYVQSFYDYQKDVLESRLPGSFIMSDRGKGFHRGRYMSRVITWWLPGRHSEEEILGLICTHKETDGKFRNLPRVISINLIVNRDWNRNWGLMWAPDRGLMR